MLPAMIERDAGLESRGLLGIHGDLSRRLPHYLADWRDGLSGKAIAASAFLFFACLAPAIAFGGLMSVLTSGEIGVIEMVVATAAAGVVYAVFAGQPLTILGGTGPFLVFTGILYTSCGRLGLPFLPTYAWVGLWTGLFVVLMGLTSASRLITHLTRFTDETFAALISLIFIVEAMTSVLSDFPKAHVPDDSALFGLILTLMTFGVARWLSQLRHGSYLRRWLRAALADFGPALAVILMIFMRHALPSVTLISLAVPTSFATTNGRPWLVPLGAVPAWVVAASAGPASLVAILVFLDQNVTVRIVQNRDNQLRRGSAYHWDLVVVGVLLVGSSLFGLPWLVAATVRSINHVRALATAEIRDGQFRIRSVLENRVSAFVVHGLIGLSLLFTSLLREIPMAVLYGLFLYMGFTSMRGNQFFERLKLWFTDPELYPTRHYIRRVPRRIIHIYTVVQALCLAVLWVVKSSKVGILFPLFIALLVPVRTALGKLLPREQVEVLDAEEVPEDVEDEFAGP